MEIDWNGIESSPKASLAMMIRMQDCRCKMQEPVPVPPPLSFVVVVRGALPAASKAARCANGYDQQSLMKCDGSNEANPSSPRRWNRFPSTGDLVRGEKLGPST